MALHSNPRTVQTTTKRVLTDGDKTTVGTAAFERVTGSRFKVFVPLNSKVRYMAQGVMTMTGAGLHDLDIAKQNPGGALARVANTTHGMISVEQGATPLLTPFHIESVFDNLSEGEYVFELQQQVDANAGTIKAGDNPLEVVVEVSPLIYPVPGVNS